MERLTKIENRLKQIQNMSDLEPYKDELIQIRGIINSYESDNIKVSFESSRTLEHNLQVSLEGIGAIKDAILDTLKRLWNALFGSRSSGGSGSDKTEEMKDKSKKELKEMNKRIKDADDYRKKSLERIKELGESGIPGASKDGYNLNVDFYKFDIKETKPQLTNNNPKNKILDAYANKLLTHIQTEFPLLFALIGKSNVTIENFKEGLKKMANQKQDPIWREYMDYVDEKDHFTNKEHNELHKFIKRADEIFGQELMPGESPISINIVAITGKKLGVLWVNKHSKQMGIDKPLSFHYEEFTVQDSFVNSISVTDNTINDKDIEEISKLIENISFFDTAPIEKILRSIEKDKNRFSGNLGYPDYQKSVLKMGQALQGVMSRLNYNRAIFSSQVTTLAKKFADYIEDTNKFRMTEFNDKPELDENGKAMNERHEKRKKIKNSKEDPLDKYTDKNGTVII